MFKLNDLPSEKIDAKCPMLDLCLRNLGYYYIEKFTGITEMCTKLITINSA